MLKLIKFTIFLCAFIGAGYFVLGLPFGEKTLYQHLVTISNTDEAQALKAEIDKKVDDATTDITKKAKALAIEKVKDELADVQAEKARKAAETAAENPATDAISQGDKAALDALIEQKQQGDTLTADRRSLTELIRKKARN